jgi:fructoselysine-6-phosphate deglycase
MMAINEFAKELTSVPVYLEQAAELIHRGHKKLNKDAVVVTLSKSGDTKESVAIAEWCKAQGIRVVAITRNADSPLAEAASWHIPMCHKNGVEYEYMLLYWLFFRVIYRHGDFAITRVLPASWNCCRKISCRPNASSIRRRIKLPLSITAATI